MRQAVLSTLCHKEGGSTSPSVSSAGPASALAGWGTPGGQDLGLLHRDRQEDHPAVGAMQVFGRAHVLPAVLHLDAPDDESAVLQDLEPLQSGVGRHQSAWNSNNSCRHMQCTPSPFHKHGIKSVS